MREHLIGKISIFNLPKDRPHSRQCAGCRHRGVTDPIFYSESTEPRKSYKIGISNVFVRLMLLPYCLRDWIIARFQPQPGAITDAPCYDILTIYGLSFGPHHKNGAPILADGCSAVWHHLPLNIGKRCMLTSGIKQFVADVHIIATKQVRHWSRHVSPRKRLATKCETAQCSS